MKRISFKTNYVEGQENVMDLGDINPTKLIFNTVTKSISIEYEEQDKYTMEDIDGMSWQALKKFVIANGGEWTNKEDANKFLVGRVK